MCRVGPGVVKALAIICIIEGLGYIGFNIFCILMWACVPDIEDLDENSYFARLYLLRYLDVDQCDITASEEESIKRAQDMIFDRPSELLFIFNVVYLALHVIWIISCCLIIFEMKCGKPAGRILFLLITCCLCGLDFALTIVFGVDMGVKDFQLYPDWPEDDYRDVGMLPVIMFSRGLIFWLFNLFALFAVLGNSRKSKKGHKKSAQETQQRSPKTSPVPRPLHPAPASEAESDSVIDSSSSSDLDDDQRSLSREESHQEQEDKKTPPVVLPKPVLTSSKPQSPDPENSPMQEPDFSQRPNMYPVLPGAYHNKAYDVSSEDESEKAPQTDWKNKKAWSYLDTQAMRQIKSLNPEDSRNVFPQTSNESNIDPEPDYDLEPESYGMRATTPAPFGKPVDPPVDYSETGSRPAVGFKYEDRSRF